MVREFKIKSKIYKKGVLRYIFFDLMKIMVLKSSNSVFRRKV